MAGVLFFRGHDCRLGYPMALRDSTMAPASMMTIHQQILLSFPSAPAVFQSHNVHSRAVEP